ncbi:hypothetical protein BJ912DRAFT_96841 [Pholiota molesta]|nr:hypothetical protein BJ912DRAFT_96841 [Pholiota molesta]
MHRHCPSACLGQYQSGERNEPITMARSMHQKDQRSTTVEADDTDAGRSLSLSLSLSPANIGRGNPWLTKAVFGADGPLRCETKQLRQKPRFIIATGQETCLPENSPRRDMALGTTPAKQARCGSGPWTAPAADHGNSCCYCCTDGCLLGRLGLRCNNRGRALDLAGLYVVLLLLCSGAAPTADDASHQDEQKNNDKDFEMRETTPIAILVPRGIRSWQVILPVL